MTATSINLDIGAARRGGFDAQQKLTGIRLWNRDSLNFDSLGPQQHRPQHCLLDTHYKPDAPRDGVNRIFRAWRFLTNETPWLKSSRGNLWVTRVDGSKSPLLTNSNISACSFKAAE